MSDLDAATRIREFRHAVEDAVAEEREPFALGTIPLGTVIRSPSVRDVYDLNFVRVEAEPPPADELIPLADELQPQSFHRRVVVDRGGESLADDFRERGWTATAHVVMAHRREPDRHVDTSIVDEVEFDHVQPSRDEVTRREPDGSPELIRSLRGAKERTAAVTRMRHFAAIVDGRIAAYCELRSYDGIAQIEDVNTMEEFRNRGLARAVVQRALEEGQRGHDLVFLEALVDDWPKELYAKLGFDVVDKRWLFTRPVHPLAHLRLRTPRLELRLATRAELRALHELAREGIHPPDVMPFAVAWTDNSNSPAFVEDSVAHHERALAESTPEDWSLQLVVFHDGHPIGVQGIDGERFAEKRTVSTGSWLSAAFQGNGLGTEMRAAVLELAFEGLGADTALSGALAGNEASYAVSRKLGYVETGVSSAAPRGEPVPHRDLRREREGWRSPVPVEVEGLESARRFLAL